jgi:hypothetical protein
LINRFSEDIDLNIECEKPTEGQRKKLTANILSIIKDYGFTLKNPEKIGSRREYNRFEVNVNSLFSSLYLKHDLIIETAVYIRSYPSIRLSASSLIYDYLKSIHREDIILKYNLESFEIQVQAVERTYVDKLFAIADYYIAGRVDEHSRHLYDLYKMSAVVKIDEKLKVLFLKVREERKGHKTCPSADESIDFKKCLTDIVERDVYKRDYENITQSLLYDNVDYITVKVNLQRIISSCLLD